MTAMSSCRLDRPTMSRCLASILAVTLVLPPAIARAQEPASPPPPPPAADASTPVTAEPAPSVTPTPPPMDTGDEYEMLRRTLPNDYDINYSFTEPDRRRKYDNDPGRAARKAARM